MYYRFGTIGDIVVSAKLKAQITLASCRIAMPPGQVKHIYLHSNMRWYIYSKSSSTAGEIELNVNM